MADDARAKQLLEEVLESGRSPDEVCRAYPELLPQVRARWQRLRSLQVQLGELFPEPQSTVGCQRTPTMSAASDLPRIPGYDVLGVLGHGGMGVVYKAWHQRLRRAVALKMLLAGAYARPEELERFLREAEAVAGLRHANIVQVYDVGDLDGRPYFTMELVEGCSLAQKVAGTPQPARAAAVLVATLAEAVQVAHQSGIVHRDLTPANILLTADGTAKITDFGLARRLDGGEGLTLSGIPMGTPGYMAPEQARGHRDAIGPATDVYALGGLLYEMLTGRPPFRAETAAATLQQVLAEEPLPPSRLNSQVPRDLETICLKCLRKEPQRRYASAAELAEDLRRFAAGEPIRARPVGRLGRTIKWVRRRPTAAALIAATLLLVAAGIGATVWYVRDRQERRVDEALRGQQINRDADAALAEAESHLQDIRARLEDPLEVGGLLSDIDLWQTTVKKSRQAWERAHSACDGNDRFVPQSTLSRLRAVEDTLLREENAYRLAKELDDIKSKALTPIDGKLQIRKAMPGYAAFFTRQGLDVAQGDEAQLMAALRKSSIRLVLAAALDNWADIAAHNNPNDQQLGRLLALARAADPDPWRNRFRVAAVWQNHAALTQLAEGVKVDQQSPTILAALANRLARTGGSAATIYNRAMLAHPRDFWLHLYAAYHAQKPADKVGLYHATLAVRPTSVVAYNNLGIALREQEDLPGAFAAYKKAIELEPNFATTYVNLGTVLWDNKDLPEAIAAFEKAIELDPKIALAYFNLGNALRDDKDLPEAIAAYKKAIEIDPKYTSAYVNLGNALWKQKDLPGAVAAFNKAIDIDPNFAPAHVNLGVFLRLQKDLSRAIAAFNKAIELDPKCVQAYVNLGVALRDQKDLPRAIAAFNKAIELDPNYAPAYDNLGIALRVQKDLSRAIAAFNKAIEVDPRIASTHVNLGAALWDQKDLSGAIAAFNKAIELDPNYAMTYLNYGVVLRDQKDLPGAITAFKKAIALDPNYALAYDNLGLALKDQKDLLGAIAAFNKAIELDPNFARAYVNLGIVLWEQKDLPGAHAALNKAIELDPTFAWAYVNLGTVLWEQKDLPGAIAALNKAIELDPNIALAYVNLGIALREHKDLPRAIAAFKKAIEVDPTYARAYDTLGIAWCDQKDFGGAVAAFKKALDINPKDAVVYRNLCFAYRNLGEALLVKGQFGEARAAALEWLKLLPAAHLLRKVAQQQLMRCDQLLALDQQLSDILKGMEPPDNTAELLALADLCLRYKHCYAAATRFYAASLDKEPKLAEGVLANMYYDAACAASLAGVGKGKDGDKLLEQDRSKLRRQALDWLQADLALLRKQSQSGNVEEVVLVTRKLSHAQSDPDLIGVREASELAGMANEEREAWQQFWADLARLLEETRSRSG